MLTTDSSTKNIPTSESHLHSVLSSVIDSNPAKTETKTDILKINSEAVSQQTINNAYCAKSYSLDTNNYSKDLTATTSNESTPKPSVRNSTSSNKKPAVKRGKKNLFKLFEIDILNQSRN